MKPTLYAEDIRDKPPARMAQLGDVLADRILPRRCPTSPTVPPASHLPTCIGCEGLGFLYPDPPEWWQGTDQQWHRHLHRTWWAFEIVEVDNE